MQAQQRSSSLAAGLIVSLLGAWGCAFSSRISPKRFWYQHTLGCDGGHDWDCALILLLLLLLHHPVACMSKSCLLKLATSGLISPNSVVGGIVTMPMDSEFTSILLSTISVNCSRLLPLAVDARVVFTLLGSHWIKSSSRRDRFMALALSPGSCWIFQSS